MIVVFKHLQDRFGYECILILQQQDGGPERKQALRPRAAGLGTSAGTASPESWLLAPQFPLPRRKIVTLTLCG